MGICYSSGCLCALQRGLQNKPCGIAQEQHPWVTIRPCYLIHSSWRMCYEPGRAHLFPCSLNLMISWHPEDFLSSEAHDLFAVWIWFSLFQWSNSLKKHWETSSRQDSNLLLNGNLSFKAENSLIWRMIFCSLQSQRKWNSDVSQNCGLLIVIAFLFLVFIANDCQEAIQECIPKRHIKLFCSITCLSSKIF